MSWMIAELGGGISISRVDQTYHNIPKDTLPGTRYNDPKRSICGKLRRDRDARFPWIHNKDVADLDFHSMKVFAWKNHIAVPSCWALRALFWLVDGSGGHSHTRWSRRTWLPVVSFQLQQPRVASKNHERLAVSM